jgi:hypothetical protein
MLVQIYEIMGTTCWMAVAKIAFSVIGLILLILSLPSNRNCASCSLAWLVQTMTYRMQFIVGFHFFGRVAHPLRVAVKATNQVLAKICAVAHAGCDPKIEAARRSMIGIWDSAISISPVSKIAGRVGTSCHCRMSIDSIFVLLCLIATACLSYLVFEDCNQHGKAGRIYFTSLLEAIKGNDVLLAGRACVTVNSLLDRTIQNGLLEEGTVASMQASIVSSN